ncbi:hypothetical protein OEZ85_010513 [Tetradesmus obliquus]|uniref:Uncharacterized protein n=1 Tax=Tetradesmus obliquus TaxID=3088 RepID=A0ABY8TRC2_TETOB|nr:hypothetical protein OEZ85_010513 [Tetradesmus obliquus]
MAAVGATTVATGQHTKQRAAAGTQPSAVGIPVTVLQSVAVATSAPPALQATVQLQGMRAAAFDAASTQLRFRQAVSQVVLRSDVFYWKVQITDVHDVLPPGAHSRQLEQVPRLRTVLPVAEVRFRVLNVSSTAAGAAAAGRALDEAVADGASLLVELVSHGLDSVYWTSLGHMTTVIADSWASSSLSLHSSSALAAAAGCLSVLIIHFLAP